MLDIIKKLIGLLESKDSGDGDNEKQERVSRNVVIALIITSVILAVLIVLYFAFPDAYAAISALVDSLPAIGNNTVNIDFSIAPLDLGFNFDNVVPEFTLNIWVILIFIILFLTSVIFEKSTTIIATVQAILTPLVFVPGIIKTFDISIGNGLRPWDATANVLFPLAIVFVFSISSSSVLFIRSISREEKLDAEKMYNYRKGNLEKEIQSLNEERKKVEKELERFDTQYRRKESQAERKWENITKKLLEESYNDTIDAQARYKEFYYWLYEKYPHYKEYDDLSEELEEDDDNDEIYNELMAGYYESNIEKYNEKLAEIDNKLSKVQSTSVVREDVDDKSNDISYVISMSLLSSVLGGVALLVIAGALLMLTRISYLVIIPILLDVFFVMGSIVSCSKAVK